MPGSVPVRVFGVRLERHGSACPSPTKIIGSSNSPYRLHPHRRCVTCASDNTNGDRFANEWKVTPLTALHETDPPTWPSTPAREALYSDVPVDRVEGMHLNVKGHLPPWLNGSFYRNGPGKFKGAHAVFDGCAMIAKFEIDGRGGTVVASHRFIETTYLQAVRAAGGDIRWKMAHDPGAGRRGALGRLAYIASLGAGALTHGMHLGDNALVSVFPQGGELVAHTETLSGTYRIDPKTLETLGRLEYADGVSGMGKTAHPHTLPNGDIINLACDFMPVFASQPGRPHLRLLRKPHMTVFRHPAGVKRVRQPLATVPYLRPMTPTWVHQPVVSRRYVVIVQNPCFYDIEKMVFGESGEHMVFRWDPAAGSLIHVIPLLKKSKVPPLDINGTSHTAAPTLLLEEMKSYRAPAFMATHWINAFESEDGRFLHCDACVTEDPSIMAHWALATVKSGPTAGKQIEASAIRRLTLDLTAPDGTLLPAKDGIGRPLLESVVADEAHGYAFELPSINPNFAGQKYRFVYGASAKRPSNCWNALAKVDMASGRVKLWHEPGAACWEPVFVPRPGSDIKDEDDGAVLCTIMQPNGRTALLVLDAISFTEVARAVLPYGLPNGFHGCFIPSV